MLSQKCIKNIAWREGLHHTENWPFAKGSQPLKRSNFRGALAAAAVWTVKLKMRIFWSFKLKFPGHFELLVSCKALIPEGLRRPWVIQNCLDRVSVAWSKGRKKSCMPRFFFEYISIPKFRSCRLFSGLAQFVMLMIGVFFSCLSNKTNPLSLASISVVNTVYSILFWNV